MQLEIGQEVDGYLIQEVLGRGGMGIVYKAEDVALSRKVALKVINPSMTRDEAFVRRFQSEARTLAKINSPNIVTIHAFRKTEHGLFIVMEYVDGGDLSDVMQAGALPLSQTLNIIKQLLRAFQDAHSAGVIHRDIKPPNIMVSSLGEVKVTDFGLAKMSQADMTKTMSQGVMGTLYYMSPEAVRGEEVDQRSDLWALGVVFYEMLTGRRPFDAPYEASVMYAIMNEPVTFPEKLQADIPESIQNIVLRVLEKNRDKRYQDATEMLIDVDTFALHTGDATATRMMPGAAGATAPQRRTSGRQKTPPRQSTTPSGQKTPKGKLPFLLGGAALVVILATAIYFFLLGPSSTPLALLSVNSTPQQANVFLDGALIGTTPIELLEVDADVENHPIRLELEGFASLDTTLKAGLFHFLDLKPLETAGPVDPPVTDAGDDPVVEQNDARVTPPAPRPGTLVLRAVPEGRAFVDDEPVPSQESYSIPAGSHTIRFNSSEYGQAEMRVNVAAGQTRELVVYFETVLTVSTGSLSGVVLINDEFADATPYVGSLGPGTYTIRVEKPGYVSVPADTTITIEPSFDSQLRKRLSFRLEQQ